MNYGFTLNWLFLVPNLVIERQKLIKQKLEILKLKFVHSFYRCLNLCVLLNTSRMQMIEISKVYAH